MEAIKGILMDQNKEKALKMALSQIEKQFGSGSIMRMGNENAVAPVDAVSTGSLSIDIALGIGGFPRGRVVEIYGPESSWKNYINFACGGRDSKSGGHCSFCGCGART